ncbi:hypothetical protein C8F01DRAFT_1342164 [Mycena amicta]|nr:hypothetical protein C8F01DRAFT_1342164 [Mycena amicta]
MSSMPTNSPQEDLEELDAAHKKVLFEVHTRWMYPAEEGKPTPLHKALKSLSESAPNIGFRHGRSRVSAPLLLVSIRPVPKPRVLADIAVQTKAKVPSDTLPEPTLLNWADDSAALQQYLGAVCQSATSSPPSKWCSVSYAYRSYQFKRLSCTSVVVAPFAFCPYPTAFCPYPTAFCLYPTCPKPTVSYWTKPTAHMVSPSIPVPNPS